MKKCSNLCFCFYFLAGGCFLIETSDAWLLCDVFLRSCCQQSSHHTTLSVSLLELNPLFFIFCQFSVGNPPTAQEYFELCHLVNLRNKAATTFSGRRWPVGWEAGAATPRPPLFRENSPASISALGGVCGGELWSGRRCERDEGGAALGTGSERGSTGSADALTPPDGATDEKQSDVLIRFHVLKFHTCKPELLKLLNLLKWPKVVRVFCLFHYR